MFKIRKKEELYNHIDNSKNISTIKIIDQKFNNNDLSLFNKLELINLIKLHLIGNGIKSIEPFLACNFNNLKIFDLACNKLNDKALKDFNKMKFSNIECINFYKNEIKSPQIFEKISQFKETLKRFYIGYNTFDEKELSKYKNKKYDLTYLEIIGLTTGCFSDKTINFISNLKFLDLKTLYLSRNNLSSLSFLKNINCKNVVSFWAIKNNLTKFPDVKDISFKEKLKKMNLKENEIDNIDNLLEYIEHFPNLEELILEKNKINLNDPKNEKIIKLIRYKNIKIII
jgi:hypothetical protein